MNRHLLFCGSRVTRKLSHLTSIGGTLPGRMIHGLSLPFTPFFDATFGGCFCPASMEEDEAADWSRDSASSATEDALPYEDIVVTEARPVFQ